MTLPPVKTRIIVIAPEPTTNGIAPDLTKAIARVHGELLNAISNEIISESPQRAHIYKRFGKELLALTDKYEEKLKNAN